MLRLDLANDAATRRERCFCVRCNRPVACAVTAPVKSAIQDGLTDKRQCALANGTLFQSQLTRDKARLLLVTRAFSACCINANLPTHLKTHLCVGTPHQGRHCR